jgi:Matrixin/IPT/TIG domain/Carboxypeptidase regulatory-like domain
MRLGARRLVVGFLLLASAAAALAHVRLINSSNGNPLHWSSPSNVSIVINATGSDDITDGSHFTALRNAISAWNHSSGTTAHIVEDTSPAQEARTDWQATDIHLMFFDETNSSGYFPSGSGTVALTPVWFLSDGTITDADVLFDGSEFQFTTNGQVGRFDVQDVATHELGHFLGLDHSGWAGATMYPYVDPSVLLHRSLSLDDVHGARDMYPSQGFASIYGTVKRASNGTGVAGAHVFARNPSGRTVGGALCDGGGTFHLNGLDAGTFALFASPLDYPVSASNLVAGHTVQTDFSSGPLGSFAVSAGQALGVGDVFVGADVSLSLGRNNDVFPLRSVAGSTRTYSLSGSGLVNGSTLTASDPTLTVNPTGWFTTQVTFQVTTPAGSAPGHADLTAVDPFGATSILPAALEITPPDGTVLTVSPSSGNKNGGTPLTITGTNFASGARIVIGENIYPDGDPGGATVVSASTITLTTQATAPGTYDVVVIDATGVEARKVSGFTSNSIPTLHTVFPTAGASAGGTTVVIRGTDFSNDAVVKIDDVPQSHVTVADPTRIVLVTDPGIVGGPYVLEVDNPGGGSASSAFAYVAPLDPAVVSVSPASGKSDGGDTLTVHGSHFTGTTKVFFGVDADTGTGGIPGAVAFVNTSTLSVQTPAHAPGTINVMAADSGTGQAVVVQNAFAYSTSPGGGGGCRVVPVEGPPQAKEVAASTLWIALAMSFVWLKSRRRKHFTAA